MSTVADEDERAYQNSVADMLYTGCIFLNPVFKIKAPRKRFGKRWAISIEGGEAVWGAISAIIVGLIIFSLFIITGGRIPSNFILNAIYGPPGWIVWPLLAFFLGRNLAHISPFMNKSGEGASAWIRVSGRNLINKIAAKLGLTPACYNPVITTMKDPQNLQRITMAREYIGIAPAPDAPWVKDPIIYEFLNEEISPEDRNYEDYPEACENVDVIPEGNINSRYINYNSNSDLEFIDEKIRTDMLKRSLIQEDINRQKIEKSLNDNESFWD